MSTYAIGDLQGCLAPLLALLDHISFDRASDRLWFCGDLVNRGPDSLAVLRTVRDLGDCATVVLGNHDLHLLAVARGRRQGRRDTLDEVLAAPDREALLDWLRRQPLFHRDETLGYSLFHAGLPPQWTLADAASCAAEAEAVLRGPDQGAFVDRMYGDEPSRWSPALRGNERLRFIVNAFTRLRYCHPDGSLALDAKGSPEQTPGLRPWFEMPERRSAGQRLLFGHWSTLGRVHWPEAQVWGLDTGAVWGQRLSALRLEDRTLFSVPSKAYSPID